MFFAFMDNNDDSFIRFICSVSEYRIKTHVCEETGIEQDSKAWALIGAPKVSK